MPPLPGYHYDGVVTSDSVLPVCDRVRDLTMTHSTNAHWHTVANTSCIMLDLTPHLLYPAKAKERKENHGSFLKKKTFDVGHGASERHDQKCAN